MLIDPANTPFVPAAALVDTSKLVPAVAPVNIIVWLSLALTKSLASEAELIVPIIAVATAASFAPVTGP